MVRYSSSVWNIPAAIFDMWVKHGLLLSYSQSQWKVFTFFFNGLINVLTRNVLCISKSCIEIKIRLNWCLKREPFVAYFWLFSLKISSVTTSLVTSVKLKSPGLISEGRTRRFRMFQWLPKVKNNWSMFIMSDSFWLIFC